MARLIRHKIYLHLILEFAHFVEEVHTYIHTYMEVGGRGYNLCQRLRGSACTIVLVQYIRTGGAYGTSFFQR